MSVLPLGSPPCQRHPLHRLPCPMCAEEADLRLPVPMRVYRGPCGEEGCGLQGLHAHGEATFKANYVDDPDPAMVQNLRDACDSTDADPALLVADVRGERWISSGDIRPKGR